MNISRVNNINFGNKTVSENKEKPKNLIDRMNGYARNLRDMNDTVVVPRTIFKGYLSFMAGTSILTLASLMKPNWAFTKVLKGVATLTTLFGTYAFVRPYVFKDKEVAGSKETNEPQVSATEDASKTSV